MSSEAKHAADRVEEAAKQATDKAADVAKDTISRASGAAKHAADTVSDVADKAKAKANEAADKVSDVADKAADKASDVVDKAKAKASEAADKVSDAADKAADKVAGSGRSIGELFASLSDQVGRLVTGQIELAKVEAISKVTNLGRGGAMFAVAGVLALYMLSMLLHSCAYAFAILVGPALGYLITAGILLLLIIILAIIGKVLMNKAKKHVVDPVGGLKESIEAAKKGVIK